MFLNKLDSIIVMRYWPFKDSNFISSLSPAAYICPAHMTTFFQAWRVQFQYIGHQRWWSRGERRMSPENLAASVICMQVNKRVWLSPLTSEGRKGFCSGWVCKNIRPFFTRIYCQIVPFWVWVIVPATCSLRPLGSPKIMESRMSSSLPSLKA